MIADMRSTVERLKTGTYTVYRRAAPTWTNGKAVAGAETSFSIDAAVGPLTDGRELKRLPEGTRADDFRQVVTPTAKLNVEVPGGAYVSDEVLIDGERFVVQSCADWSAVGGFYRAIVQRKG